jgi:hypothetical protein
MMKKVYAMAQTYTNYDANEFSSVWTKVVLPTIKSEMKLQMTGYAMAIKNQVIQVSCTYCQRHIYLQLINLQLLACPLLYR